MTADSSPPSPAQRPDGHDVCLDRMQGPFGEREYICTLPAGHDQHPQYGTGTTWVNGPRDALLADLDAAREALRRAGESIAAWTRAADRAEQECQRLQGLVEDARAERDRMRPVVEAARAASRTNPHSAFPEVVRLRLAERAAVDTYETQTGGTE